MSAPKRIKLDPYNVPSQSTSTQSQSVGLDTSNYLIPQGQQMQFGLGTSTELQPPYSGYLGGEGVGTYMGDGVMAVPSTIANYNPAGNTYDLRHTGSIPIPSNGYPSPVNPEFGMSHDMLQAAHYLTASKGAGGETISVLPPQIREVVNAAEFIVQSPQLAVGHLPNRVPMMSGVSIPKAMNIPSPAPAKVTPQPSPLPGSYSSSPSTATSSSSNHRSSSRANTRHVETKSDEDEYEDDIEDRGRSFGSSAFLHHANIPAANTVNSTGSLLEKLQSSHYLFRLKSLESKLKEIRASIVQNNITNLEQTFAQLHLEIDEYKREFLELESTQFLEAQDFKNIQALQEFIDSYLLPQLHLYKMDVAQFQRPEPLNQREMPVYLSVIQETAGPIFKEKPIGPFTVRLLTGASIQQIQSSPVHPELVDVSQRIKHNNAEMENQKQTFNENGSSVFSDLKFSSGTFPNLVKLRFKATIQVVVDGHTVTKQIESPQTKPFISMTNTGSQWKDSQGSWLKEDCFKDAVEITMAKFWNYFQKHYLIATKQDVNQPKRPLHQLDFDYLLMAKFKLTMAEKPTVTQKEFEKFWDWIGPALKKIRYQKYLLWLFEHGYLIAFVTGPEAEAQLSKEIDGTFLIRLSERLDGEFVITYKHQSGLRHYLIQPDDTADKKKTLIDFLGQNRNFIHILQVQHDGTGKQVFYRHNKDKVLQKYYKKAPKQATKNNQENNPYDTSLPIARG